MKKKTDSKTNADKTFEDILLDFQTRLQGVANGLAAKLGELIASTDAAILRTLVKELPKREKSIRAETRRIERLIAKIEKMRRPGFDAARDLTFETALEVGDAASSQTVREIETAQQDAAERGGGDFSASKKNGKRPKSLSAKQVKEIVEYEPIDGESIAGWFEGLRRGDLQRITRAVARASVEGLTVSAIAAAIRGTKANGYRDGILQTTRDGAAKLARTTINGVCNNARLETIRENEDVVDGAKFVGTLDGRTCPHCGALDGKIWPVKELDAVRRPPIHISCRCCVVPHIDLRTPDGKIVEVGTRPAANADFDALAKESYNKTAREKGLKRRWDDLSPSTRLKYYYQAQKDYERRTGKPAYRQVSPSTTFRDYFERQPAAFQRAWLGKNRYELYRTGAATFDDLTKPASTYSAKLKDLRSFSPVPEGEDERRSNAPQPAANERRFASNAASNQGPRKAFPSSEEFEAAFAEIERKVNAEAAKEDAEYERKFAELEDDPFLANDELDELRRKKQLAKVKRQELLRYEALSIILPLDKPTSGNRVKLRAMTPEFVGRPKADQEYLRNNTERGLDFLGRLLDNLGVEVGDALDSVEISSELVERGFYERKNENSGRPLVKLSLGDSKKQGVAGVVVHECAHAIEHLVGHIDSDVKALYQELTTDSSKRSFASVEFGKPFEPGERYILGKIEVPNNYVYKICAEGTEMTSMFAQILFEEPWQVVRKADFYKAMVGTLRGRRNADDL